MSRDERTRRGVPRYGRLARLAVAGSATAVVLLMVASPLAGALRTQVITPPFRHTTVVQSSSTTSFGTCKRTDALLGNRWLPSVGNVTGFGSSSAKGCASVPTGPGTSGAGASDSFVIAFPFSVYRNAGYNLSLNFTYDYTVVGAFTGAGTCPTAKPVKGQYSSSYCARQFQATSAISMYLWDATNKTSLYGAQDSMLLPGNVSYAYNSSYCYNGSCYAYNYSYGCSGGTGNITLFGLNCIASGTHVHGTGTLWINTRGNCGYAYNGRCYSWLNWTLNHLHKFWVVVTVGFNTYADLYNFGGGHTAIGTINGATLGNKGWGLRSLTIS